jgi:hypothetical protein
MGARFAVVVAERSDAAERSEALRLGPTGGAQPPGERSESASGVRVGPRPARSRPAEAESREAANTALGWWWGAGLRALSLTLDNACYVNIALRLPAGGDNRGRWRTRQPPP